jgi:uncharacterized protein (DUF362 family)/Pyruvate/2-oxoacid:ferredoxin oxidoreductase delta subunit
MKSKVAIARVDDYQRGNICHAIEKGLRLLGGLGPILKPRSRVFVKINHLSPPSPPEKAIVTHPDFTREVLRLLKDLHLKITVGDDIQSREKDGFLTSGYRKMCDEMGIRLVNLKEEGFREVKCDGQLINKTYISPLLLDSDYIINLPKLKTHSFTIYTGAVKNMFGIIPYGLRLSYHRQFQKNEAFSQMLVDIFSCAPPHLTIMDAVVAMEGEGPSSGDPRKAGIILASEDAIALDAVASKIAGFEPWDIASILNAHQRGLGTGRLEEIEVLGEKIQHVEMKDFKQSAIAVGFLRRRLPASLYAFIQDQLIFIPEVRKDECTHCLECVKICPSGAAEDEDETVWIDRETCIHCMCCHEVCRFQAIKLKQKPMGHIIRRLESLYRAVNRRIR